MSISTGNVYEAIEGKIRGALAGRRRDFVERCARLGVWLARKHGPASGLRIFPVPRQELAADERFQRQVGLTGSQIRTALAALLEHGFLVRLSLKRENRRFRDSPTQFELGAALATLFSKTLSRLKKSRTVQKLAPLFVATWKTTPFWRPVMPRPEKPRTEAWLADAYLAHLKAEIAATGLPRLSADALRAGRA